MPVHVGIYNLVSCGKAAFTLAGREAVNHKGSRAGYQ